MTDHTHPVFARLYRPLAAVGERLTLGRWRTEALAPASGTLLVIGLGPGFDLRHLPPAVTRVVAVEPDPTMRAAAAAEARRVGLPVHLLAAVGEALPLAPSSVDSVLLSLVLCSVDDPQAVLAEISRVLRAEGVVCVLEHVRDDDGTTLGALQDRLDAGWARIAGGCHANRRTRAEFERAGYDTAGLSDARFRAGVPLLIPHLRGAARPPRAPRG